MGWPRRIPGSKVMFLKYQTNPTKEISRHCKNSDLEHALLLLVFGYTLIPSRCILASHLKRNNIQKEAYPSYEDQKLFKEGMNKRITAFRRRIYTNLGSSYDGAIEGMSGTHSNTFRQGNEHVLFPLVFYTR